MMALAVEAAHRCYRRPWRGRTAVCVYALGICYLWALLVVEEVDAAVMEYYNERSRYHTNVALLGETLFVFCGARELVCPDKLGWERKVGRKTSGVILVSRQHLVHSPP